MKHVGTTSCTAVHLCWCTARTTHSSTSRSARSLVQYSSPSLAAWDRSRQVNPSRGQRQACGKRSPAEPLPKICVAQKAQHEDTLWAMTSGTRTQDCRWQVNSELLRPSVCLPGRPCLTVDLQFFLTSLSAYQPAVLPPSPFLSSSLLPIHLCIQLHSPAVSSYLCMCPGVCVWVCRSPAPSLPPSLPLSLTHTHTHTHTHTV